MLRDLINKNYSVTCNRNKITKETEVQDFIDKIQEELNELSNEWHTRAAIDCMELADIILVCFNFAKHYNIDIERFLQSKIEINERRND